MSLDLSWRDKLAILDTTARIAAFMLLAIVLFCGVWLRAAG